MTYKEERLNHQRKLSATEKILKIQELKTIGKTQVQIAEELNISRRTVCTYWNTTDTISKQEAQALARKQKEQPKCAILLSKPENASLPHKPAHTRRKLTVSAEEAHDLNLLTFSKVSDI